MNPAEFSFQLPPYDILRSVINFITDGNDLINYLNSYKHLKTFGDLVLILEIQETCEMLPQYVWPVLHIREYMAFNDDCVSVIRKGAHLFRRIKVFGLLDDYHAVIPSMKPVVECFTNVMNLMDEGAIKLAAKIAQCRIIKIEAAHNHIGSAGKYLII